MLKIIPHRKIWFIISGTLLLVSVISLILWQLKLGIDFTGGSLIEIEFQKERPDISEVEEALKSLNINISSTQPAGEKDILLRMETISEEQRMNLLNTLFDKFGSVKEKRFESIGPVIGKELKRKAIISIILVVILIILYVAYAFRKVSKQISSWKLGVCTVLALLHDVLIVIGCFSLLGKFLGVEVDILFATALLTILGYSVNDTIVVFDRIRYNLIKSPEIPFEKNVNLGVNQTITRSINTSLTTLLVLFALYLFGGQTISWFIFALILGFIVGTYSSIFLASPLLVVWEKRSRK